MSKAGKGKKSGLRVFWIPTGHKKHKNKYYVRDNYDSPESAMMSGDSPNSHSKELFDFKEGRSTPPPTTSKDIAVQSGSSTADAKTDVVAASSVLAEPPKEHGPGTNYVGVIDPHADHKHDDDIVATEEKPLKSDDHPEAGDKRDVSKKINGMIDKVDGNLAPSSEKKQEEEEDDSCAVKCLYYTLQCCECTVM